MEIFYLSKKYDKFGMIIQSAKCKHIFVFDGCTLQGNGAQPGDQADAEQPRGVAAGDQLTICDQLRNTFGPSFNASDDGDCAQPIEVARDD